MRPFARDALASASSRRLLAGSGLLSIGRVIDLGFNAVGLILVARLMGPTEFGALSFATAAAAFAYTFTDLGLSRAYVQRIAEGVDVQTCISTFFLLRLVLLCVAGAAVIGVGQWAPGVLGLEHGGALLMLMMGVWSMRALAMVSQVTLESQQQVWNSQAVLLAYSVTYLLVVPAAAWLTRDAQAVAVATLVPAAAAFVVGMAKLKAIGFGRPSQALAREYVRLASPLIGGSSLNAVAAAIGQTLLQAFWGSVTVGYFAAAQRFTLPINAVWGAAGNYLLASTVRGRRAGLPPQDVVASVRRADSLSSFVLVALIAPIVVESEGLVVSVLGSAYSAAAPAVALLAVQAWSDSANVSGAALLLGANRSRAYFLMSMVETIILIGLVTLTVPTGGALGIPLGFGLAGAAGSAAFVSLVALVSTEVVIARAYGVRVRVGLFVYFGLGLGVAWLVSHGLSGFVPDLPRLSIDAALVGGVLVSLSVVAGRVRTR
jgi:O-antigen/teichoic acid export membrane protein